jgi:hypothetical protein
LFLDSGQLVAGVNPGGQYSTTQTIESSGTYDDGKWHLAAFTDSSSGIYLYVDGSLVASNATVSGAQPFSGWWSIGLAKVQFFPQNNPSLLSFFNGDLAGVAVLGTALNQTEIQSLYGSSSFSSYTSQVESYTTLGYWGLQDPAPTGPSSSTATLPGQVIALSDTAGDLPANTGAAFGGITSASSGPLNATASTYFNGSSGYLQTPDASDPQTISEVAWFKTSSSSGGTILGMADVQGNAGLTYWDRMIWVDNSGNVVYGVAPGGTLDEVPSGIGGPYDNGQWHFVVAEIGSSGEQLYVDNVLVSNNPGVTSAQVYSGYWHIGWDSESGWYDPPTSSYFNGAIAGVAIFPTQLTSAQINTLYTSSSFSAYSSNIAADSPSYYWPLQYAAANYPDFSGSANNATAYGGVTPADSGPLSAGASASFDGSSGYAQTVTSYDWETFTAAAWFKTSSGYSSGGAILGLSNVQSNATPTDSDRIIWMDDSGKLNVGTYPGTTHVLTSASSYNDGNWHLVVAELGAQGQQLWVDGTEVASNSSWTTAQGYAGYWHIGWDYLANWGSTAPASNYFSGSIAGAAVFPTQLSANQVVALYSASSFSYYSGTVIDDGASAYWSLTTQPNACSAALATVSITGNGATTCLLPPLGAGTACPAVATGGLPLADLMTALVITTVTLAANGSATLTINCADNGTLPGALRGADVQVGATVSAADGTWQAGAVYANSQVNL